MVLSEVYVFNSNKRTDITTLDPTSGRVGSHYFKCVASKNAQEFVLLKRLF